MIINSASPDARNNRLLKRAQAKRGETNRQWLKRVMTELDQTKGGLVLIGGSSVVDFRIRFAQSHLRHDLTPSYWSTVGIVADADNFLSVPLKWDEDLSEMPHRNGITSCRMLDYDDPDRYPNVAFIQFATEPGSIVDYGKRLKMQRSVIDLPSLVVTWLEYVWAVGDKGNPLIGGRGLPSAVFAETVFGIAGIELTPGLAAPSSCPEAIWQAAKWWSGFYEEMSKLETGAATRSRVPEGYFTLRQSAAAIYEKPFRPKK